MSGGPTEEARDALGGIMPAVASPCDEDDKFLEDEFAGLVTSLYQAEVDGLYVCGATGQGGMMRLEERKRAAEIAMELSRDRHGTVIVHVGASNTRDAIELAEHAAGAEVAAVASIPPPRCNHVQVADYYSDIARAAGIPVLVYHVPVITGYTPTLDEMVEFIDIPGVVGVKLTDWNLRFLRRLLIVRPDTRIFSGWDSMLLPALMYGACGGIGTWYNVFPKLFLGIFHAWKRGDIARAMEMQDHLVRFVHLGCTYGLGPLFEHMMRRRGFALRCRRRPRLTIDREILKRIEPELKERIKAIEEVCRV